jgi:hypothetical protein
LEIAWRSGAEANLWRFPADPFYSIQEGKDEVRLRPFVKNGKNKLARPAAVVKSPADQPSP